MMYYKVNGNKVGLGLLMTNAGREFHKGITLINLCAVV